tara:strand:- start:923 stop:1063 length:141 start_codon:yes stop_codon:yes gene_type:complete
MIWQWLKKLFTPKKQSEKVDYSKMTKGDLKKLQKQGKIKDIYNPNN